MTNSGWIIMLLSIGSVSLLFIWCIFKVLTIPKAPAASDNTKRTHLRSKKN